MNRDEQATEARRLGREHASARQAPYGDLDDGGSADLMTALGETDETTAENWDHRRRLCAAYMDGWEAAAGYTYGGQPAPDGVLTPRRFVLALAADGIDAELEYFGGPREWPYPMGWLPDGRGWILGDANGDLGGPDEALARLVHLQVYESAQENAARWPDGHGLEFNDPIGILGDIPAARAAQAIRRAWAGDYSEFTDDQIGPAPLTEDLTTGSGSPMFTDETRAYLRAARLASPAQFAPWRTEACPECGDRPAGGGLVLTLEGSHAHVLMRGSVVLGCEGYQVISPAALGLPAGQWEDWRLTHDAGYINEDPDGQFTVTMLDAYVGDRVGTYPEALALLRDEAAALPVRPEPPMFYVRHEDDEPPLIVRLPRLVLVREDWDRRETPEDAAWWGSLPEHIGVEAMCLLCGQTCNPHGPDEMVHNQRLEGDHLTGREVPCGGPLVALGAWGAPVTPGRASAIGPVRPQVGIPYGWTDPETGAVTCPACQAVIAEEVSATGEPTTANYAQHYAETHGPAYVWTPPAS
jgi:hypothetical protein